MKPPTLSFIGKSGSGKTTLLVRLIPLLKEKGLRVGSVKRSHHEIEIDRKGKDSWQFRQAGADPVMVAGGNLWALMKSTPENLALDDLLKKIGNDADLVLVEGFKEEEVPAIVVVRKEIGWDPSLLAKRNCKAVVTDFELETHLPRFSFQDGHRLVDFILTDIVQNGS